MGGRVLATYLRGSHPVSRIPQGGALRLSSKTVPKTEEDGREAAAQENGTGAKRLPYARSGTQMGNKARTKNVRIYGEHGGCNTLCLFMDHGWGRSYSLWSVPFKIKQKALSEAKTLFKKGKKIINKTKSVSRANTLLGKENQRKDLRQKVV